MKSAFCPVIRNNSPPARRQHIAKVCCFPIGTRLNSRQSRKPTAPQSRKPVPLTEPETRAPLRKPSPAPCQSRKLTPLRNPSPAPCQSRKLTPFRKPSPAPYRSRKPTAPQSRKPVPLTEPEATPFRKPSPAPYRSRKPTAPQSRKPVPLTEPETRAPLRNPSSSFWFPRQSRKTIWRPAGTIIFSCAIR